MPSPNSNPVDSMAEQLLLDETAAVPTPPAPRPEAAAPADADADAGDEKEKSPRLTPAERWRKTIAAAELDEQKANQIIDDVVMNAFYQEERTLLNGRVKVILRTREPENINRVSRAVGALVNPVQDTVYATMALVNLAGALQSFWKKGMKAPHLFKYPARDTTPIEAATMFDERMEYLMDPTKVGSPVLSVLFEALGQFDNQVRAALSEGAAEGF